MQCSTVYTILHCIMQHCIHYTALHCIVQHFIHYIAPYCAALYLGHTAVHCGALYTQRCTVLFSIAYAILHSIVGHCIYNTALYCAELHTLQFTMLYSTALWGNRTKRVQSTFLQSKIKTRRKKFLNKPICNYCTHHTALYTIQWVIVYTALQCTVQHCILCTAYATLHCPVQCKTPYCSAECKTVNMPLHGTVKHYI